MRRYLVETATWGPIVVETPGAPDAATKVARQHNVLDGSPIFVSMVSTERREFRVTAQLDTQEKTVGIK